MLDLSETARYSHFLPRKSTALKKQQSGFYGDLHILKSEADTLNDYEKLVGSTYEKLEIYQAPTRKIAGESAGEAFYHAILFRGCVYDCFREELFY